MNHAELVKSSIWLISMRDIPPDWRGSSPRFPTEIPGEVELFSPRFLFLLSRVSTHVSGVTRRSSADRPSQELLRAVRQYPIAPFHFPIPPQGCGSPPTTRRQSQSRSIFSPLFSVLVSLGLSFRRLKTFFSRVYVTTHGIFFQPFCFFHPFRQARSFPFHIGSVPE